MSHEYFLFAYGVREIKYMIAIEYKTFSDKKASI
jgi:hypothetical protein